MHCYVYASQRKADSYLWLAARDAFENLPADLAQLLGPLRFVMELDLHESRRLPHEDPKQILTHLRTQGWHLQVPPSESLAAANHLDYGSAPQDRRTP